MKPLSLKQRRQRRKTQEFWCITIGTMIFPILLLLTAYLTRNQ